MGCPGRLVAAALIFAGSQFCESLSGNGQDVEKLRGISLEINI